MNQYSVHNTNPNVYTLQYAGETVLNIQVDKNSHASDFIDLVNAIVSVWNIARPDAAIVANLAAEVISDHG